MKTSLLTANRVYAIKTDTYSQEAPVLLIESVMWKCEDTWGRWDGAERGFKARTYTRAAKGDRAGRGASTHSTFSLVGLPVLKAAVWSGRFTSTGDEAIVTEPSAMFHQALAKMNLQALFAEGCDGRKPEGVHFSMTVSVTLADGSTEPVTVTLEYLRPQVFQSLWIDYVEEKRKGDLARADYETKKAERQVENDKTAFEIISRTDTLLGRPTTYKYNGERYDLHRKSTGISTTYEVSEELLLKLLALAEKESAS